MKVFVLTYPCGEGHIKCMCKRVWQTEVHETREAAEAAAEGRMFAQILECEVGASWQSSTQTWTKPKTQLMQMAEALGDPVQLQAAKDWEAGKLSYFEMRSLMG